MEISSSFKNERIFFVDIVKGIGIFLVVVMHVLQHDFNNSALYISLLSFTMPLFFVCSGFVSPFDKKVDLNKKTMSLIFPTLFFTFINILLFIFCSLFEKNLYSLFKFGGFWFLIALFCCSILNFFIEKMLGKFSIKIRIVVTCIVSIVLLSTGLYISSMENNFDEYMINFIISFFFYVVGQLFRLLFDKKIASISDNKIFRLICFVVGLLFFVVTIVFAHYNIPILMFQNVYGNPFMFLLFALIGTLSIFGISFSLKKFAPLEWIGKKSLIIMIIHFPINALTYLVLTKITTNIYLTFLFNLLIVLLITLPISWFLEYKVPYIFGMSNKK